MSVAPPPPASEASQTLQTPASQGELELVKDFIARHWDEDLYDVVVNYDSNPSQATAWKGKDVGAESAGVLFTKSFEVVIAGVIRLKGTINTDNFEVDASLAIYIPIWGWQTLVHFKGNLKQGIIVNVGVGPAKGSLRLYLQDGWVWAQVDISFLSHHIKGYYKLFKV